MFGGFQKEKGATVDLLLHYLAKTAKVSGESEEIDFRIKIALLPSDSLALSLERLSARAPLLGLKGDVHWGVVGFRGEEAFALDPHAPIASFKLTSAMREVRSASCAVWASTDCLLQKDLFLMPADEVDAYVRDVNKKKAKRRKAQTLGWTKSLLRDAVSGETIYYALPHTHLLYKDAQGTQQVAGELWLSNYRVLFAEDSGLSLADTLHGDLSVPLAAIASAVRSKGTLLASDAKSDPTAAASSSAVGASASASGKDRRVKAIVWTLYTRDWRELTLAWAHEHKAEAKLFQRLVVAKLGAGTELAERFCFASLEGLSYSTKDDMHEGVDGWRWASAQDELRRHGYDEALELWTVTTRPKAMDETETSLPRSFIVPLPLAKQVQVMVTSAQHRRRGRFPVYTWGCWNYDAHWHGSVLLRAERPRTSTHSAGDVALLTTIFDVAANVPPPTVRDERGQVVHKGAGHARGLFQGVKVFNTGAEDAQLRAQYTRMCDPYEFLALPSLTELRDAWARLGRVVRRECELSALEQWTPYVESRWPELVQRMLGAATRVVSVLARDTVMIEHGSEPGCEYDAVLATLVQLMVDAQCRTLDGFCRLLDKEWVQQSFPYDTLLGHGFGQTQAQGDKDKTKDKEHTKDKGRDKEKEKDKEKTWSESEGGVQDASEGVVSEAAQGLAPWLLLLCCVREMLLQRASAFEFDERLLLAVWDALLDCRFGTFFFDTDERRQKHQLPKRTHSLWSYLLWDERRKDFFSPVYRRPPTLPRIDVLTLDLTATPALWGDCFLRHVLRVRASEAKLDQDAQDVLGSASVGSVARGKESGTTLTAAGTDVAALRVSAWPRPEALHSLALTRNRLTALAPEALGHLTALRTLLVQENGIAFVPDALSALTRLEVLNLARNRISGLGDAFGTLKALHTLTLSENLLTALPPSFAELSALTTLNLADNRFSPTLPDVLTRLTQLERLDMTRNRLSNLKSVTLRALVRLRTLQLSRNEIYMFALTGDALPNLVQLELADNALETLPDGLGALRSLRTLIISNNKLRKLPASICTLSALETLDARGNRLTALPASIGQLGALQRLWLNDNAITELPLSVQSLARLEELQLARNQLRALSHALGQCRALRVLDVQGNAALEQLPATLSYLRGTLAQLLLDGCMSLRTPPPEVQRQGTEAVLGFLGDLLGETERVYRVKLMVVGQENVGKTTTITQLVRRWTRASPHTLFQPEQLKGQNISTDGIDIGDFTFPLDDGSAKEKPSKKAAKGAAADAKHVTVNVWDFAGQDVYVSPRRARCCAHSALGTTRRTSSSSRTAACSCCCSICATLRARRAWSSGCSRCARACPRRMC